MKDGQLQTGDLCFNAATLLSAARLRGILQVLPKPRPSVGFQAKYQNTMNEQQRQAYLEAMGIQVYYPRQPLANALASPEYSWPEPAEPVAEAAPVSASESAGDDKALRPASARVVVDLEKSRRERRRENPADTARPVQEQEAATVEPALQFRLAFYRLSPDLAVLSELPLQARSESA